MLERQRRGQRAVELTGTKGIFENSQRLIRHISSQFIQKRKYSETRRQRQGIKSVTRLPPTPALRRLAAALHYRDFRVLWIGAFTSSIGTWMQKVAQNWLVLTIAGSSSAFYLGLDSFLGELPILLFTLIGGVVADRRDRRQMQIGRASCRA